MDKFWTGVIIAICVLLIIAWIFFGATPGGRGLWNNWWHDVQKVDDNTRYDTRKQV